MQIEIPCTLCNWKNLNPKNRLLFYHNSWTIEFYSYVVHTRRYILIVKYSVSNRLIKLCMWFVHVCVGYYATIYLLPHTRGAISFLDRFCIVQEKNQLEADTEFILNCLNPQPFNRRCHIYSGFHFLLAHYVPPFKHVKDKMWHQSAIFENSWPPIFKSE